MIDAVFHALAEQHRRDILRLVLDEELTSGEIASFFTLTRPAISQHLQVLADAGLVTVRREGTKRLYRARPEGLVDLRAFLEEFWDERLRRLKRVAEAEERKQQRHASDTP